jgi:hypothetical protein
MRDRWWIAAGLALLIGLLLSPWWYNAASDGRSRIPSLVLPRSATDCVAPVAYMKSSHMILLNEWRHAAVRQDSRVHTAYNGQKYEISLTGTCLSLCHEDKAEFCDRCHAFNGVPEPQCWDCHLDPKLAAPPAARGVRARGGMAHGN